MSTNTPALVFPKSQSEWQQILASLPDTPEKIPAFFFAHGSPMLAWPEDVGAHFSRDVHAYAGPKGPQAAFLRDFGKTLIEKYKPKGIVVFSAHWETASERLVTDYGEENPLLMDYYGLDKALYELKFQSRGDAALSKRVVDLYKEAGQLARTTPITESRGRDGRGCAGPGFDHGVFVPFRIMFGESFTSVPIVEVSIHSSMSPTKNWEIGTVVTKLREEGILVLSGGLTVHNLRESGSLSPTTASEICLAFNEAVLRSLVEPTPEARKLAMIALTGHQGFRAAHPREDHFVPIYVAAGAGEEGKAKVLSGLYGATTVAFGL